MNYQWILWISFIIAIVNLTYWIKKPPFKQWMMMFLLTSTISVFLDNLFVNMGLYQYPLKLIPYIDISVVFDFFVYPLIIVWTSYFTYHMKWMKIMLGIVLISLALTSIEGVLEAKTELIKYVKWSSKDSFVSFIAVASVLRLILEGVKKYYRE